MKPKIIILTIIFVYAFIGCSNDESSITNNGQEEASELYFPPLNSSEWKKIEISDLNWNSSAEQTLYNFLEEKGTKAFIILKDGKIAVEEYFNGGTSSSNNPWYSAGKTLTSFTVGLAQEDGFLNINNSSSDYLGTNWSNLTISQEQNITVKHHLTMTTGLDFSDIDLWNCTLPSCLTYFTQPGTYWFYHNATYTLNQAIVAGAVNTDFTIYFNEKLRDKIGMQGTWLTLGYSNVYLSTARSMARFGLLNLNKGSWNDTIIMNDLNYFTEMTTTSQDMNKSYGYLWWLNGKDNYRSPASISDFQGELIPNAPDDLIAGLGKDDQKLYVVPSKGLVIVRMGDSAGESLLGPSSFDNELWEKLNDLIN